MVNLVVAILAALLLLLLYLTPDVWHPFGSRQARLVSARDGARYRVHLRHRDAKGAADRIADLNRFAVEVMRHLRDAYARGADGSARHRRLVHNLLTRYDPDNLVESSPNNPSGDTSFTVNKGAVLAMCLREQDPTLSGDPTVHDFHVQALLRFVMLHELAHVAEDNTGHGPSFWAAFKWLLLEVEQAGIYTSPDFAQYPEQYCGMRVDYNPRYDPTLAPA